MPNIKHPRDNVKMVKVMCGTIKVKYKVNNKDWYQITAKFTDHLKAPDLSTLLNFCYYRQL